MWSSTFSEFNNNNQQASQSAPQWATPKGCWLCLGNRSDYTIQCIHWLKGNAFIPRELFCHKFYTQVKLNAVYPAESLLIGEYTYLWGYFPENPQIALCQLFRKGVPSTPKEPWVQPSKRHGTATASPGQKNQKNLYNIKGCFLTWLSFREICSAQDWSPQLEAMKRPSASDVPHELPVLFVCLAVA